MFWSFPRIGTAQLAALCRRAGISLEAGIDVRKVWQREAERGPWQVRPAAREIRDAVARGDSVADGMARSGRSFPPLLRQMVKAGERSGGLPEVLKRMSEHYDHRVKLRRMFLASLAWPLFQLGVALFVVGLLIWITGFLAERRGGEPIDLLGFGLTGDEGLLRYLLLVQMAIIVLAGIFWALRRGFFWTRPLQRAVLYLPVVGPALTTLSLARMAWTLHLTLNVEMNLRRVMPLALLSTGNDYYTRHIDRVVADLTAGREIHEALRATGAFPREFLSTVEIGENSGQLVEAMQHLSTDYEARARQSLAVLTQLAGFAVWALVAAFIITLIFRLATFYLNTLSGAGSL